MPHCTGLHCAARRRAAPDRPQPMAAPRGAVRYRNVAHQVAPRRTAQHNVPHCFVHRGPLTTHDTLHSI
eukprot:11967912-Alexandrium_andersonii.AAC.1